MWKRLRSAFLSFFTLVRHLGLCDPRIWGITLGRSPGAYWHLPRPLAFAVPVSGLGQNHDRFNHRNL
jgi:hypothetical protein